MKATATVATTAEAKANKCQFLRIAMVMVTYLGIINR
jgi:hypothetical protein